MGQITAMLGKQFAQYIRLRQGPREAIKDEASAIVARKFLVDQTNDDFICDQLACVHDGRNLLAHLSAGILGLAQHIARGQLDHVAALNKNARLCAFASTGWSKKDNVHLRDGLRLPRFLPALPRSWDFSMSPSY